MRSIRAAALLLGAALLLSACTTTVAIRSTEPGPVAVGGARHLVILDGDGRRSARESVFLDLARQARRGGWFTVDDLSQDGHRVRVEGRHVRVRPRYPLEEESAGLRIDIHEWRAAKDTRTLEKKNEAGELQAEIVHTLRGSVVLGVTLFDAWDRVLLAEREYGGTASGRVDEISRTEVIERSAEAAITRFLADVTPRTITQKVRLDDDDDGQESILQIARDGNTALAARRMEAYADRHPHNAGAAYNLAVLLDALGERREALAWYDRALELGYEDYYASARAACAHRIASAEALLPAQPPASFAR